MKVAIYARYSSDNQRDASIAASAPGIRSATAIVLTPAATGKELGIELKGKLAAMLGASVQRKGPSESDDRSLQVSLVAGARNPLNLDFSWTAA